MLYYMQDLRRQPNQEITPELNDLQEEIGAHFTKGRYIVPLPEEGNGIPLVKLKSGDIFQPIFTDVIEFQRFNREKKFRPVVVDAPSWLRYSRRRQRASFSIRWALICR